MSLPFPASETGIIFHRYRWPASWITLPQAGDPPYVLGFKLTIEEPHDTTVRLHLTADERFELLLDGQVVARGPERGSPERWYYLSLDLPVKAGRHLLFARVWALGEMSPCAQMTVRPGFLLAAENGDGTANPRWSTGLAPWEVKRIEGYEWSSETANFSGQKVKLHGAPYPWGIERGEGPGWTKATVNAGAFSFQPTDLTPIRLLAPGTLPAMLRRPVPAGKVRFVEDVSQIGKLPEHPVRSENHLPELAGRLQSLLEDRTPLTLPAGRTYRAIIDLENYFCAYPRVTASGGQDAELRLHWAEALFEKTPSCNWARNLKGNRHVIENLYFAGIGDTFIFDGTANRTYTTLWWEAGRYVELLLQTRDEALVLHELSFEETRYPLGMESAFSADDKPLENLVPLLLRSLQMNAHETFMDCPYYEQLNYTGDTLIDCLVVYTITQDVRLVRKSLQLFHDSHLPQGLTQSRFPSRIRQIIPPFSLLWVSMVRNHAWWRGEPDLIRSLLPATRSVIDTHLRHVTSDGLLRGLRGWNFLDWVEEWTDGVPPGGEVGEVSGPLNWLFVYILQAAAELEGFAGEPELAARYVRLARAHARATEAAFWNEERGLFANDLKHGTFSEHAQCLALLGGHAEESLAARAGEGLVRAPDLHRCTIYFSHYLFETYRLLDQMEPFFSRLDYWRRLPEQGFVTTPEMPEPSRSDCHAWGCHPLFHFFASLLGIRPAAMGFGQVEIRPRLGPLAHAAGRMIHPGGWIEVDLRQEGGRLEGTVVLPEGVTGTFHGPGGSQSLGPGRQKVSA